MRAYSSGWMVAKQETTSRAKLRHGVDQQVISGRAVIQELRLLGGPIGVRCYGVWLTRMALKVTAVPASKTIFLCQSVNPRRETFKTDRKSTRLNSSNAN